MPRSRKWSHYRNNARAGNMPRSETPPPFEAPLIDSDEADASYDWYWGDDAGGYTLDFGKYAGKRLREVRLGYLLWCRENLSYKRGFVAAFDGYHAGLQARVAEDYARFVVPFGAKHRGKMIGGCRDKDWFRWTLRHRALTSRHPLYFEAVKEWLRHPRPHMAVRDVGELCVDPREYELDVDVYGGEDEDGDYLLPSQEREGAVDADCLAQSGDDDRSSSESSSEGDNASKPDSLDILEAKAEETRAEMKHAKLAHRIEEKKLSGYYRSRKPIKPTGSKGSKKRLRSQRVRSKSDSETLGDFVEEVTSASDNASYIDISSSSGDEDANPSPERRVTRGSARRSETMRHERGHETEEEYEGLDENASNDEFPPAPMMVTRSQRKLTTPEIDGGSDQFSEGSELGSTREKYSGDIEQQSEQESSGSACGVAVLAAGTGTANRRKRKAYMSSTASSSDESLGPGHAPFRGRAGRARIPSSKSSSDAEAVVTQLQVQHRPPQSTRADRHERRQRGVDTRGEFCDSGDYTQGLAGYTAGQPYTLPEIAEEIEEHEIFMAEEGNPSSDEYEDSLDRGDHACEDEYEETETAEAAKRLEETPQSRRIDGYSGNSGQFPTQKKSTQLKGKGKLKTPAGSHGKPLSESKLAKHDNNDVTEPESGTNSSISRTSASAGASYAGSSANEAEESAFTQVIERRVTRGSESARAVETLGAITRKRKRIPAMPTPDSSEEHADLVPPRKRAKRARVPLSNTSSDVEMGALSQLEQDKTISSGDRVVGDITAAVAGPGPSTLVSRMKRKSRIEKPKKLPSPREEADIYHLAPPRKRAKRARVSSYNSSSDAEGVAGAWPQPTETRSGGRPARLRSTPEPFSGDESSSGLDQPKRPRKRARRACVVSLAHSHGEGAMSTLGVLIHVPHLSFPLPIAMLHYTLFGPGHVP
ncbi:hypothetical protein HWV62_11818 [Athelia sp. TMB]|nr:hypothetical protein HWV62_11818 [Athelia sp. TMB]